MNIVFKDWKDLPRFSYAGNDATDGGRWSYRNGGFNDGDIGTWYIVNIKPVFPYDYTYFVYQLPPEICYVVNSMIAESHNDVLDMVTGGLPNRMHDDGMWYVDGKEETEEEEDGNCKHPFKEKYVDGDYAICGLCGK